MTNFKSMVSADIIGLQRMMLQGLNNLRLNEFRIVAMIAEYMKNHPEQGTELTIPIEYFMTVIELYDRRMKDDFMEVIWGEVVELHKRTYQIMTGEGNYIKHWIDNPHYTRANQSINMKIDEALLPVYEEISATSCLPYDYFLSWNAVRLLKRIVYGAEMNRKYKCYTCKVKSSLFKTKSANWKDEALLPAMQDVTKYYPYQLEVLEDTASTVLIKIDPDDEDTAQGKENLIYETCAGICKFSAQMLNPYFPDHNKRKVSK